MCHHWHPKEKKNDLSIDEWRPVFQKLAQAGVSTLVLSGGEPLARADVADLLEAARWPFGRNDTNAPELRLGLLTSGIIGNAATKTNILERIAETVDWVAVSIDGTKATDRSIRNPVVDDRSSRLQDFCNSLLEKNDSKKNGPRLSATVTLQKKNIETDCREMKRYILSLGISEVNFKFATGTRDIVNSAAGYLPDAESVETFCGKLFASAPEYFEHSNLAYIRRCFAEGVFSVDDVAAGAPVRSFYTDASRQPVTCFTPYVFSLIDAEGKVFPCCHLYRDNHGGERSTGEFREKHCMGSLREVDYDFMQIWNAGGDRLKERGVANYGELRGALRTINVSAGGFQPCGECTRHCQHNRFLSKAFALFESNDLQFRQDLRDALPESKINEKGTIVWF